MKHEDIVDMAKAAGAANFYPKTQTVKADNYLVGQEFLERFAKLVAAKEREACAKEAEDSDHVVLGRGYYDQLGDADATVRNIAAAIRARGEA